MLLALVVVMAQAFQGPAGVACHPDGRVFVVDDFAHRIVILDRAGHELGVVGSRGAANGQFLFPDAVAFGADGLLYVADTGANRIQVLRESGEFVRAFGAGARPDWTRGRWPFMLFGTIAFIGVAVLVMGSTGSRPTAFALVVLGLLGLTAWAVLSVVFPNVLQNPRDVLVRPDGTVWVADFGSNLVRVFDARGELLASHDAAASGQRLNRPLGLAADAAHIYVSDSGNHRVVVLDATGAFVRAIGTHGQGPGQFAAPHGLALAGDGRLFVADRGNRRVQVFSSDGQFADAVPGDFAPAGLCLTRDGRLLVVDLDNHRVVGW